MTSNFLSSNASPKDMRSWIAELDVAGELLRIDKPVDPLLRRGGSLDCRDAVKLNTLAYQRLQPCFAGVLEPVEIRLYCLAASTRVIKRDTQAQIRGGSDSGMCVRVESL